MKIWVNEHFLNIGFTIDTRNFRHTIIFKKITFKVKNIDTDLEKNIGQNFNSSFIPKNQNFI